MLPLSLLTIVCVGLTAIAVRELGRCRHGIETNESLLRRIAVARAERSRFAVRRAQWSQRAEVAEAAVGVGTAVTEASHRTIAAIPFEILEAIPQTSETTKIVRGIHDEIAGGVYDAISALNKGIGSSLRGSLAPRPRPPQPSAEESPDATG